MSRNKFFKYYCIPLMVLSQLGMPGFLIYYHYVEFNAYLLFSAPIFYLLGFIPWVIVDVFDLLEWE